MYLHFALFLSQCCVRLLQLLLLTDENDPLLGHYFHFVKSLLLRFKKQGKLQYLYITINNSKYDLTDLRTNIKIFLLVSMGGIHRRHYCRVFSQVSQRTSVRKQQNKASIPAVLSLSFCHIVIIFFLWNQCPTPSTSHKRLCFSGYFSKYCLQAEQS